VSTLSQWRILFEYLEERDGVTVEDIDRRGGEVEGELFGFLRLGLLVPFLSSGCR
jgi:hypothetical protein